MRKIVSFGKRLSAIAAIILVAYSILLLLFGLQIIPHPGDLYWFFLPSLVLAPIFLISTVCLDIIGQASSRKWTTAAWVLATINCTMIIMIYGVQAGMLSPSRFQWQTGNGLARVFQQHTFLVTLEFAGCFLISTSIFISAFAFRNRGPQWFFYSLVLSVLPLPALVISYIYPPYYYLASIWFVTFSIALVQTARFFKLQERKLAKKEKRFTHPLEWVL